MTSDMADLDCQELVEIITDYLEGTMASAERARFDAHLEECDACQTYLDQMRVTIEITGRIEPGDLAPAAEQALLDAFRTWKKG